MAKINPLEKHLIFDGAMGTMLQEAGLKTNQCPEIMIIEAPKEVLGIHKAYIEAGADVLTTNTFGGNRIKLSAYNLEHRLEEINRNAVQIARQAAQEKDALVAASVGPTGRFVYPLGDLSFDRAYNIFKEQITALALGCPDLIILETFSDMGEIRAALLAAKDSCKIPVICSLTFEKNRTLTGVSPASAAVVMESLGAAAIGANCSGGPLELLPVAKEILETTSLPVIIQPNAGLPTIQEEKTHFTMGAEEFARAMKPYLELGVPIIGSCCGSTPAFSKALHELVHSFRPVTPHRREKKRSTFAGRESIVVADDNLPTIIIGERINPSARKKLKETILMEDYSLVQEEANKQVAHGAHMIDLNAGIYEIDQGTIMENMINILQRSITAPLVLDTTDPVVIEKGLKAYHGKALVNSVNGDEKVLATILPIVKRYGAAVIGLTLDEKGVPAKARDRFHIATKIVEACLKNGIPKEDIYIDCLVMAVGAGTNTARETLHALATVKKNLKVKTVLGVSNVSHGMPARKKLNTAFFAMAIAAGLDLAIVNPLDKGIMDAWQAACLLAGRDPHSANFIKYNSETEETPSKAKKKDQTDLENLAALIVEGSLKAIESVKKLLRSSTPAQEIVDKALVPGLVIAGARFEEGIIYLPQLMLSAEAAQKAFALLDRHFGKTGGLARKGTVVIGTVKGDVHDIGKNLVAVMLKNSGYKVVDLGKNVAPQEFIDAAEAEKADIVALSALMTTTMIEIPKTIKLIKKALPAIKIIAGGAVVTNSFALASGADGYGKDAVSAVRTVDNLLRNNG